MSEGDAYANTVARLEPNIHMIDAGGGWASIAISLKRIADALEWMREELQKEIDHGQADGRKA